MVIGSPEVSTSPDHRVSSVREGKLSVEAF